jgi:hypothetical protein
MDKEVVDKAVDKSTATVSFAKAEQAPPKPKAAVRKTTKPEQTKSADSEVKNSSTG